MAELKTSISIRLKSDLARKAKRDGDALVKMGRRGKRAMKGLRTGVSKVSKRMGLLGNRFTALLGVAGMAGLIKTVVSFEKRITRLGTEANVSQKEIEAFGDEVRKVSEMPDIGIDPDQLLDAVDMIIQKTSDLKFARDNLRNIALVIQGAGAAGKDTGAFIADMFEKFDIRKPEQLARALASLVNQMDVGGGLSFREFATQGERVASAFAALGVRGPEGIKQMGAMMQIAKKGTGNVERAATSVEAFAAVLLEKAGRLQKRGIEIFKPGEVDRMRSMPQILKEIIILSKKIADETEGASQQGILLKFFGKEAFDAIKFAVAEFNKTGSLAFIDKFTEVSDSVARLNEKSARNAKTAAATQEKLGSVLKRKAEDVFKEPLKSVSKSIVDLLEGKYRKALRPDKAIGRAERALAFKAISGGGKSKTLMENTARLKEEMGAFDRAQARLLERLRVEGRITVEFQNAPAGMRVKSVQSRNLELEADMGQTMVNP